MMAASVVDAFADWGNDPFADIERFKEDLVSRWVTQEDEILIGLIADLAEGYRQSRTE